MSAHIKSDLNFLKDTHVNEPVTHPKNHLVLVLPSAVVSDEIELAETGRLEVLLQVMHHARHNIVATLAGDALVVDVCRHSVAAAGLVDDAKHIYP